MKVAGIICEYNPFHLGHAGHIEMTRQALGGDSAIVCVMSGNFVQRGEPAVFNKHARSGMAIRCGADLVVELPLPYALSSAEGFARAGVYILDRLGICEYISFGSELGDIGPLRDAAGLIVSKEAEAHLKLWLKKGFPYATAQQRAADAVMGEQSALFKSPNNLLGIEYLKALAMLESPLRPITVERTGGTHDSDKGFSASAIRKKLLCADDPWALMPLDAALVTKEEIASGRGPVSMKSCELAMLSRLRAMVDYSTLPGATEGLEHRLMRFAASEPSVDAILEKVKTKRYAMSRLRRMLMCACLGITAGDSREPPPYIRVLAMNRTGRMLLREAGKLSELPIITKPASVQKLSERAVGLFLKEAAATDFYSLAYPDEGKRHGGQEWRQTPFLLD